MINCQWTRPELDIEFDFGSFAIELQLFHWSWPRRIANREDNGHDGWMAGPVAICVW
jgi:hypothetical protein